DANGNPYWDLKADDNTRGNRPTITKWELTNKSVPIPVGRWFKFDISWSRGTYSQANGRVRIAIDGKVIFDHRGQLMGRKQLPMLVIMPFQNYGNMPVPSTQMMDDFEVRTSF